MRLSNGLVERRIHTGADFNNEAACLLVKTCGTQAIILGLYGGLQGIMENRMETTIMENQMEKKMENEMETGMI